MLQKPNKRVPSTHVVVVRRQVSEPRREDDRTHGLPSLELDWRSQKEKCIRDRSVCIHGGGVCNYRPPIGGAHYAHKNDGKIIRRQTKPRSSDKARCSRRRSPLDKATPPRNAMVHFAMVHFAVVQLGVVQFGVARCVVQFGVARCVVQFGVANPRWWGSISS